jgi:hypothetical protein
MTSTTHGTPEHEEARRVFMNAFRGHRNRPGDFWVAAANPAAAYESITGTRPVEDVESLALLSDRASRLVDRFDGRASTVRPDYRRADLSPWRSHRGLAASSKG